MMAKTANERIIFGLKVKQLRQEQGLSFADLSKASGMSLSYLNEIEKGKKFPKTDKVSSLAEALGTSVEELTNDELGRNLAPVTQLLQSNFLNELPLELFGIELGKVAEIIAQAPTRVGAFISTLLELSRSYALREENFYFAALRSYLELHDNYFPELEEAVEAFARQHRLPTLRPIPPRTLASLLEERYGYEIVPNGLDDHPDLAMLRAYFQPEKKRLLLNGQLSPVQRSFQFGKELGFNHLKLVERANTSSLLRSRIFEEVLNHSKATYFSVALHIPLQPFVESVREFFALPRWDGEAFLALMQRYNATPEMFYHRLTNVIPQFFGLREMFFLRVLHNPTTAGFAIDKELHLHRRHHPHENGLFEHYCRRWVSISVLQEMTHRGSEGIRIDVQRSQYFGTEDEYLCLTMARTGYPQPEMNVSVTLGFLLNPKLRQTITWTDDPAIPIRTVNTTCERCPIMDCAERAAEPVIVRKREKYQRVKAALKRL
ncbi:helix-turn-helix domain-containing protein [Neolewinella lacunae]|uniref:Helix-turn-helix domain-containing protein n=2 Tax=Neolewinella lacunae TaxID=1517758 RepID=A0A923PMF5_9BACT|nr:helix-turn-helix transcriptional regulator [Neolewinella lacunae]MBC6994366.1 helix-turn-helix domain-containing protein [Neolewinella lacunae]MDN3633297.1 helix-turn-helix domain-containing protein [Neolewinella lacunae]